MSLLYSSKFILMNKFTCINMVLPFIIIIINYGKNMLDVFQMHINNVFLAWCEPRLRKNALQLFLVFYKKKFRVRSIIFFILTVPYSTVHKEKCVDKKCYHLVAMRLVYKQIHGAFSLAVFHI